MVIRVALLITRLIPTNYVHALYNNHSLFDNAKNELSPGFFFKYKIKCSMLCIVSTTTIELDNNVIFGEKNRC